MLCFNYPNKQLLTYNDAKKLIYNSKPVEYFLKEFKTNYKDSDINANMIMSDLINNFVFLKEKQVYLEQFNLIGFYITGGNFKFSVSDSTLYDFVYTDPTFNEKEKRWIYQKKNLPEIINGYYLYKGNFNTNSVYLEIDDKK